MSSTNGNGNGGNGDGIVVKPTTLLLNLIERQAISETQLATILSEQNEARESRRLMHKKLDEIGLGYAGLSERVTATANEVAALKPKVAELERLRQTFSGGLLVLGGLASLIMVAVGFALKDLWGWFAQHLRWN